MVVRQPTACPEREAHAASSRHHAAMGERRPGQGRYAHVEVEQRWVVASVPDDARPVASILDRYIHGTRLRLRRSESDEGVVYKLGQKVRDEPTDPETVRLTNIY